MPYRPTSIPAHDACYPPIAYLLVKCFPMTSLGEDIYVATLFAGLFASLVFFLLQRQKKQTLLCMGAVLLTVPFACGPLRGNTTAWATSAVFVFLAWFDAKEGWKRFIAAVALGLATSLKITPVIYGCLYIRGRLFNPKEWPLTEISIAAESFAAFFIIPFLFFGGLSEIPVWFQNALANSAHYSREADFGLVPFAYSFRFCLPPSALDWSVCLTNCLVVLFSIASFFARRTYHALVLMGVAIAFLCHHDYGLTYLLPAFACWLGEIRPYNTGSKSRTGIVLAEGIFWFLLLESATCAFSVGLLYFGYFVYNVALLMLGLMSVVYVITSNFRQQKNDLG